MLLSLPQTAPDMMTLLNYSEEEKKPNSVSCREMRNVCGRDMSDRIATPLSFSQESIPRGLQHLRDCYRNHTLVNCERASSGLAALNRSPYLEKLAHQQANQLAQKKSINRLPLCRLRDELQSRIVGENIMHGSCIRSMSQTCARDVPWHRRSILFWHRRNILSDRYNEIGVGIAKSKNGEMYMVQFFRYNHQNEISVAPL
jgi:hypothetical protein